MADVVGPSAQHDVGLVGAEGTGNKLTVDSGQLTVMITFKAGIICSRVIITLTSYFFVLNFPTLHYLTESLEVQVAIGEENGIVRTIVTTHKAHGILGRIGAQLLCLAQNVMP